MTEPEGGFYYLIIASIISAAMAAGPIVIAVILDRQQPALLNKMRIPSYVFLAHLSGVAIGAFIVYCGMLYLVTVDPAWKDFGIIAFPGAYLIFFLMGLIMYNLSLLSHILVGLTFPYNKYAAFIILLTIGVCYAFYNYKSPPENTFLNFLFFPISFITSNISYNGHEIEYNFFNRSCNAAIAAVSFFVSFFVCKPLLEKKN